MSEKNSQWAVDISIGGLRSRAMTAREKIAKFFEDRNPHSRSRAELYFAHTMANIQIAQELNDIKHILVGRREDDVKKWLLIQQNVLYSDGNTVGYQVIDLLIDRWDKGQ